MKPHEKVMQDALTYLDARDVAERRGDHALTKALNNAADALLGTIDFCERCGVALELGDAQLCGECAFRKRFELRSYNADGTGEALVDGDVDLAEFYRVNDLEPADVNEIGALLVGEEWKDGGGAAPIFVLRRTA